MRNKLNLGTIAGIRIFVHWTFLLIIAWAVYVGWQQGGTTEAIIWTVVFVLSIFVCVVLHELGHALTAQRFGIETRRITLLPIGGVASLERMPEKPRQELIVAIMGPVVNVLIAALLYFFVESQLSILQQPEKAETFLKTVTAENFLLYLFITNIALVVFNLIPAFPMDGGRMLRAVLSFSTDRVRATQIAANIGQVIAVLFFFLGLAYNFILIFIGLFVFLGASGEYRMVRHMGILQGHQVREAMMSNFTVFDVQDSLDKVGKVLLAGAEREFVVQKNGEEIAGIIHKENISSAFKTSSNGLTAGDIMDQDFKTVRAKASLNKVYRMAQRRKSSFFPVTENDKLIGVIDMENINEFMMIQANLDY